MRSESYDCRRPKQREAAEARGRTGCVTGVIRRTGAGGQTRSDVEKSHMPLSEELRRIGNRDGREGFEVTCLGFGAAPMGRDTLSDADALGAVAAAHASGVGFYDTAPWYSRGRSERRLGVALSNFRRDQFKLQTKFGRFIVAGQPNDRDSTGAAIVSKAGGYPFAHGAEFGVMHDYSYDAVVRQHEDSLQRLGVSHVDSLVIHDLDLGYGSRDQVEMYLKELVGGARALANLRTAGTIKAFGCGCNHFDERQHCDEFARRVAEIADLDYYLIAGSHYTLLDQQALDVQFPIMEQRDMSAIIGTPLASGRLAGAPIADAAVAEKVSGIRALCEKFNTDIIAASLQFPLAHPRVSCIIPGSANARESQQNKELLDSKVPGDLWRSLKEAGLLRSDAPTPGNSDGKL
jgi:D-threo-aldose 1-dehydrogenase